MKKILALTILSLILFQGSVVLAEEEVSTKDLEIEEPTLLPTSPFYFFKTIGQNIQSVFTFDPIKKAELKEKFANEALIEAKKIIELGENEEAIKEAINNYREKIQSAKEVAEKIKETAQENENVGTFLDKFIQQQTVHHRVLEKLETQVPEDVFLKISEAREEHLEKFAEVMTKLETDPELMKERIERNFEQINDGEFIELKKAEILRQLEEKVSQEAREVIQEITENSLDRLSEEIGNNADGTTVERFKNYINNVTGDSEKRLELLDTLKEKALNSQNVINTLNEVKNEIQERIRIDEGESSPKDSNQERNKEEIKIIEQKQEQININIDMDAAGNLIKEKVINTIKDLIPSSQGNQIQNSVKSEQ